MSFHESPKTLELYRLVHDLPLMLSTKTGRWRPRLPTPSQLLPK